MTKDEIRAVLERVPAWPEGRQQELAEIALEIEAELATGDYEATPEESAAIDEGLVGEAASEEEVKCLRSVSQNMRVEYSQRALAELRQIAAYHTRSDTPASASVEPAAFPYLRAVQRHHWPEAFVKHRRDDADAHSQSSL
jgi:hypothetical protein